MPIGSMEERCRAIIDGIEAIAPKYILHLPSSNLKPIIAHFLERPDINTFPVTREEEGVGILAGLAIAGQKAVMVIQDNGLGNMLTALTTFPQSYHVPILIIVSRRGGLGEYNSMIHNISEHVEKILEAAGLRYFQLDGRIALNRWSETLMEAYKYAGITHRPIILLVDLVW